MKVKKRKRGDMKEKRKKEEKINENVYQSNEEDIEEQEAEDNVHCDAAADIHEDHNNTQAIHWNREAATDRDSHDTRVSEEVVTQQDGIKKRRKRKKKKKTTSNINTPSSGDEKMQDDNLKGGGSSRSIKPTTCPTTLYVEGIPYDATEDDIVGLFEGCTEVRMPRWHDSGRIRGYAHIDFFDEDKATKGLTRDGYTMGTRYLSVKRANEPKYVAEQAAKSRRRGPEGCRLLFVKNLPYDTTERDVRDAFKRFGAVTGVRLACWNHTKNLKGFGYVEFEKSKAVETAVRLQSDVTVGGRQVVLDYETSLPKGSFRLMDGKQFSKTSAAKKSKY